MSIKTWFRATRETVGLTQQNVADDLSVSVRSVKRWERDDLEGYDIPDEAIEYMNNKFDAFMSAVSNSMNVIYDLIEDNCNKPDSIQLTYYRDQEMHDILGREKERFGVTNALNRSIAVILECDDISVDWAYPTDLDKIQTP